LKRPWKGRIYANVPFQAEFMNPFVDKLLEQRANQNALKRFSFSVASPTPHGSTIA